MDDANTAAGLPKLSSVYSNIQAPTTADLGGSLATDANNVNTGTNNAFSTYAKQAGSLTNPTDYYQGLLNSNGIPQLQKTSENLQNNINDLQDQIYRTTPEVTANTANSLVTDSQRQGMIAAKTLPMQQLEEPLSNQLGQVNNSIATQEQNVNDQVGALNTYNSQQLGVGALGVTVAQDNAARTMTGFTSDAANQLAGLLQKMQIQGTLDNTDLQTLSTLSTQKQAYQNALGTLTAGVAANNNMNQNKLITVGQGSTVINPVTGNVENPGVLAANGTYSAQ